MGASALLHGPPAPTAAARPCWPATSARPRRARRLDPATASAGRRSRGRTSSAIDALRAHAAGRLPAAARSAELLCARPARRARLARVTADAGARRRRSSCSAPRAARAWLHGSALHGDVPLGARGQRDHRRLPAPARARLGWPSPKGGAGRLADALAGVLTELGGELRCGQPVVRVMVERGRAAGVELAGGERLAARIVIADVTPHALLELADLPDRYAVALRPLPLRPADAEGRLGARRPDPGGRRRRRARPGSSTWGGGSVRALRPAVARRPRPAPRRQAHGVGVHARRRRSERTGSRRESNGSRPGSATASSPATCSRPPTSSPATPTSSAATSGRRIRARPADLPAGSLAGAIPDADPRALPRQRGDVPGRRGARRAGLRGGPTRDRARSAD